MRIFLLYVGVLAFAGAMWFGLLEVLKVLEVISLWPLWSFLSGLVLG